MFAGEGGNFDQDTIDRNIRQERRRKAFVTEPHPDTNGSLGSKIAAHNRGQTMNPPHKQWSDAEVETMAAIHGLTIQTPYKVGEIWYVKMAGAGALATVMVHDITEKTVELRLMPYGGKNRYIKSDITFVEKEA